MTPNRMTLAPLTLDDYNQRFADRHLLHGVVAKWAKDRPEAAALISAETCRVVTWREFDRFTTALACEWLRLGFKKGNYFQSRCCRCLWITCCSSTVCSGSA